MRMAARHLPAGAWARAAERRAADLSPDSHATDLKKPVEDLLPPLITRIAYHLARLQTHKRVFDVGQLRNKAMPRNL